MPTFMVTLKDGRKAKVTANSIEEAGSAVDEMASSPQGAPKTWMHGTMTATGDQPSESPQNFSPVEQSMRDVTKGYGEQAALGIALPITRLASGVGSMLPQSIAKRLPNQSDVNLLEAGATGRPVARGAQVATDAAMLAPLMLTPAGPAGAMTDIAASSAFGALTADEGSRRESAIAGGVGSGIGRLGGRAVTGLITPSADARTLMASGIQPTVGQALGGAANRIEQAAVSVPGLGAAVAHARNRPLREFERDALKKITGSADVKTVQQANEYSSKLFDDVVPYMRPTRESAAGVQSALREAMANPQLTPENKRMLSEMVNQKFSTFGRMDGAGIQQLDRWLGEDARKYAAGDAYSQTLGEELVRVQMALRDGLDSGLPAELQGKYREATQMYRSLIPINKASSAVASGNVMPRALEKQMAALDKTQVSRMPDNSTVRAAARSFPDTLANSGSVERAVVAGAAGGGGAAMLGALPAYIATGTVGALGSMRPVQRALLGGYSGQQGRTARTLSDILAGSGMTIGASAGQYGSPSLTLADLLASENTPTTNQKR